MQIKGTTGGYWSAQCSSQSSSRQTLMQIDAAVGAVQCHHKAGTHTAVPAPCADVVCLYICQSAYSECLYTCLKGQMPLSPGLVRTWRQTAAKHRASTVISSKACTISAVAPLRLMRPKPNVMQAHKVLDYRCE